MNYLYILSVILISIGITLLLLIFIFEYSKTLDIKKRKTYKYAILIPARNESKVIKGLLESIKKQTDNMNDVYIVVEDENDETVKIANLYRANIFVRKDFENKKRKGYALDEVIKEILKTNNYDLYFIIDADNILDDNFIKEMLETYKKGYDIGVGYRNIKNCTNVISACSGLTFSFINTISNEKKNKQEKAIIISGTGYYISGNLINKWKGFPFHSLTEDYELSLYAEANNISTYYNKNAIFYDEQPTTMKVSLKQRTRWVKGFLESRKIRLDDIKNDYEKLIGIIPYLFIISGIIVYLLSNIFGTIYYIANNNLLYLSTIRNFIILIIIVYLILLLATLYVLLKENNKLNMDYKIKIKVLFFNPIFLITYIYCFIIAVIKKEIKWETIEHKEQKIVDN